MKKQKNNTPILNYMFSIGFVVFLITIFVLMSLISRFVLSDINPIGEHVKNTKNLLEDVSEVKKVVEFQIDKNSNKSIRNVLNNKNKFKVDNYRNVNVTDINYMNINSNKSIITMFFDREIFDINNTIFYVKIDDVNNLKKKELLVFNDSGILKLGEYVSYIANKNEVVLDIGERNLVEVKMNKLLGVVFFEKK